MIESKPNYLPFAPAAAQHDGAAISPESPYDLADSSLADNHRHFSTPWFPLRLHLALPRRCCRPPPYVWCTTTPDSTLALALRNRDPGRHPTSCLFLLISNQDPRCRCHRDFSSRSPATPSNPFEILPPGQIRSGACSRAGACRESRPLRGSPQTGLPLILLWPQPLSWLRAASHASRSGIHSPTPQPPNHQPSNATPSNPSPGPASFLLILPCTSPPPSACGKARLNFDSGSSCY